MIFFGSDQGCADAFRLISRLMGLFNTMSGLQQGGGMGADRDFDDDARTFVREAAEAVGLKVKFVKPPPPRVELCMKCGDTGRRLWGRKKGKRCSCEEGQRR